MTGLTRRSSRRSPGALLGGPVHAEAILTWVVREGVTNMVRHSRLRHCEIRLTQNGGNIQTEVRDDDPGPRVKRAGEEPSGSGLSGLAECVDESGGDFEAGPLPGGFGLCASLPLGEGYPATISEQASSGMIVGLDLECEPVK